MEGYGYGKPKIVIPDCYLYHVLFVSNNFINASLYD